MDRIRITALRHSAFYTPLLVTMAGDFLDEQGLEPEYTPASHPQSVPDSLRSGEFHLSQSAVATSFADLEQGKQADIVHFAAINSRDGFFIASRNKITDFHWRQLKGRTVLVDHFFQPMAMLRYGLYKHGISLDEIDVIDAGDVAAIEKSYRDGTGEFVHMQGPAPQQLEHEGLARVVASVGEAVGPVAFSSLCASRDWLKTDMAYAFMAAYKKALDYVASTPAAEIAKLEHEAGFLSEIDISVLSETIAAYQAMSTWNTDPVIGQPEYETLLDVFIHSGYISQRHPYNSAIVLPPES